MFFLCATLVLGIFLPHAWGQVIYTYQTTDCTSEGPMLGNAVYCCSGACLDGTRIGEPGQCENWLNLCGDVNSPPSCAGNQVLQYGDPPTVDSGDGCCGACCCECQFQRNNWSWSCCDCPAGFVAVDGGACGGTASPPCVGCQEPDQTLIGDTTSGYQCVAASSSSGPSSSSTTTTSSTPASSSTSVTSSASTTSPSTSPSPSQTSSRPSPPSSIPPPSTSVPQQPTSEVQPPTSQQQPPTSQQQPPTSQQQPPTSQQQPPTSQPQPPTSTPPPPSNTPLTPTSVAPPTASQALCELGNDLNSFTSALSLLNTYAGALCRITTVNGFLNGIFGPIYAEAIAVTNPTTGILGNIVSGYSAVLASMAAFLGTALVAGLLPEEAAAAGVLTAIYEAMNGFCNVNSAWGYALTFAGLLESEYLQKHCPNGNSPYTKRKSSPEALFGRDTAAEVAWPLSPRSGAWNPCAELVDLFPNSSSIPGIAESACVTVQTYDPAKIGDAGLANATTVLQQVCRSNNLTALVDFAKLVDAVQAVIPYCNIAGNTTAIASSSNAMAPTLTTSLSPQQPALTTSTVFYTTIYTVTSCAAAVTDCPARTTTALIPLYTTVCPVAATGPGSGSGSTASAPEALKPPTSPALGSPSLPSTHTAPTPGGPASHPTKLALSASSTTTSPSLQTPSPGGAGASKGPGTTATSRSSTAATVTPVVTAAGARMPLSGSAMILSLLAFGAMIAI